MNSLKNQILLCTILFILPCCNRNVSTNYTDIQHLLEDFGKQKKIEYNKFPPRLVKAFLRMDKDNNEGLQELLGMSNLFIVAHISKSEQTSEFKNIKNSIDNHLERLEYEEMINMDFDNIRFAEYYSPMDSASNSLVLEIIEPSLYTIYHLKGRFTRDDIVRVSKEVSPVQFLILNRKIRNK